MDKFKKNAESRLDSANSQNLVNLNSCEAPEISPASWCKKSESKGAEVPPADFLLEADKRGSPPKSEKRQLLVRRGSGAGGAALLREEKNNNESAESIKNQFIDCHADSANLLAMTENKDFAESSVDSANQVKNTRLRSIIIGANGLSLGISIVVAILLGVGAGILMQKIFKVAWVLFLGVFWGVAAAVLNVYKVYKAELRDFEKLANDPKYKY